MMLPDPQLFVRTFGSLVSAYDAAGLSRTRLNGFVDAKRTLNKLRQMLFNEVCSLAREAGAIVGTGTSPYTFIINGKISIRVEVVPFRQPARGLPSWKIFQKGKVDFVIAARHDRGTENFLDFFLLPEQAFSGRDISIKTSTALSFKSMRYLSVRSMFFADTA